LAEGIRGFAKDIVKLEEIVQAKINASKKDWRVETALDYFATLNQL
jgi:hypothetical protein